MTRSPATALVCTLLLLTGTWGCASAGADAGADGARLQQVAFTVPGVRIAERVFLYLPPTASAGEKLPAVLYLHGGSQRGDDPSLLERYGPVKYLRTSGSVPFILIAPQLPEGEIWTDPGRLIALVDELSREYPIDLDRLYVTGMSMGGRGAWYLAYKYPERVAAIVPVATYSPISHWAASGRLRNVPVLAFHGDADPLAPFADAVQMDSALRATGGRSELRVLRGRNHFISDVFEDPSLYEWMLRHRRR